MIVQSVTIVTSSSSSQPSNLELSTLPNDIDDMLNHRTTNTIIMNHSNSTRKNDVASILTTVLVTGIPFLYLALVYRIIQKSSSASSSSSSSKSLDDKQHDIHSLIHTNNAKKNEHDTSVVTFADVAGMDDAVRDMQQIVQYVHDPIMYQKYGAHITRGILLHGPPGSGKTLLVRALSQEIQQQQQQQYGGVSSSCPVIACAASSFVELYVGRGAARVRQLFQLAQQRAIQSYQQQQQQHIMNAKNNHPSHWMTRFLQQYVYKDKNSIDHRETSSVPSKHNCCMAILFIDELDALAKTRSSGSGGKSFAGGNDEREQTLNQLLTEMDGFHTVTSTTNHHHDTNPQPIIIVIGATNRVDVLDPAILRRFDRHIHVPYPNHAGRKQILQIHARHIPSISSTGIDWDILATMTHDMSGSDLQQIVNEAALLAVRECYDHSATATDSKKSPNGDNQTYDISNHFVTQKHLESAIQRHRQRSGQVRK